MTYFSLRTVIQNIFSNFISLKNNGFQEKDLCKYIIFELVKFIAYFTYGYSFKKFKKIILPVKYTISKYRFLLFSSFGSNE